MEELLQIMKNTMKDHDSLRGTRVAICLETEIELWIDHLEGLVNEDA